MIHPRGNTNPRDEKALETEFDNMMGSLQQKLKFGFKKIGKQPFSNRDSKDDAGVTDGVTYAENYDDIRKTEIWTLLNIEVIRPLLEVQRPFFQVDKLGLQCWIATTIVHEW